MKKIAAALISTYQIFISSIIVLIAGGNVCRFEETCSQYSKRVILEKGVLKGTILTFARLLKCQPFYHGNLGRELV